jgi:pyroglutamyl-peptidase
VKILLTGFEPFDNSAINPSEQVVSRLVQEPPAGIDLAAAVLPVDTGRAPAVLLEKLAAARPEAVVCLGEARRRSDISIERVALNLLDFRIPDNQGVQVVDEPIRPDGPAAYFSTLPVRRMVEAVQAAGVPCNQVMYVLLDHLDRVGLNLPAGFIHLPALPEQAASFGVDGKGTFPSMSLDTMVTGIRSALAVLPD